MAHSAASESENKLGVLLFNLGGPESLKEVRPFLYNLFSDPDIIRVPNDFLRKMLAAFIAFTRQWKSRNLYRQIGGGSPLRKITDAQAAALRESLGRRGHRTSVYVGMRCWKPTIDEAVSGLERDAIARLVVLPLFPQFSFTTTGSCFNHFRKLAVQKGLDRRMKIRYVDSWFHNEKYLGAMKDVIEEEIARFADPKPENVYLLYSAHSIPQRYVAEGDPYQKQTEATVKLINERLGNRSPSTLAYQSKVGPIKWLGPPTKEILRKFGQNGTRQVLAVPVSFVSDHIETLQEIDILYRDLAASVGIPQFRRAASLNLNSKFIEALADLAVEAARDLAAPPVNSDRRS